MTQQPTTALRTLLHTMADRLDHDPEQSANDSFTPPQLHHLARDINGGPAPELTDIAPRITTATTRGEYAARLRQIAGIR